MLSWAVLFATIFLTVAVVSWALREVRRVKKSTSLLVAGIEARTREEGSPAALPVAVGAEERELGELLDDALQGTQSGPALCAVHELEGMARLSLGRIRAVARGAGRIPLLGAVAAGISILALAGMKTPNIYLAAVGCGVGFLGSIAAQLLCKKALSSNRKFLGLCEELARQVEARWAVAQTSTSVRHRASATHTPH